MDDNEMVKEKTWKEFRDAGLLLLINQFLHIFGWALVVEVDDQDTDGPVIRCYPARVKFRGFDDKSTSEAYAKISKYMKDNGNELYEEAKD
jgi:hypothetical protein